MLCVLDNFLVNMFLPIYINHFRFCLCFSISRTNNAINNAVHNTGRGYNNNNVASVSGSNHNNGNHFPNAISSVGTVIVRAGSTASIGGSSSSGSSRISSGGGSNTVSNNNVIMANGPIASGTRSIDQFYSIFTTKSVFRRLPVYYYYYFNSTGRVCLILYF